jgi:hypothetical protein
MRAQDGNTIPQFVQDLAATVNGKAIAYREIDDRYIVIVMQDGRKLNFDRANSGKLTTAEQVYAEGTAGVLEHDAGTNKSSKGSSRVVPDLRGRTAPRKGGSNQ